MDEQPGTSKDLSNKNNPDEESNPTYNQDSETYVTNYSSKSRLNVASMGVEKTKPPSKPKGKFEEKKRRKRRTGRVEKQRKPPTRRHMTKRMLKRKPRARYEKKRDLSASTMYSRLSSGGLLTPTCERCGHRCCQRRYKRRVTIGRKRKVLKKRKQKFQMTVYKSENIQVGSCSKMLSPLNVNANSVEVEEAPTGTFREITPEMIHDALKRLTMWRQNVETGAIYDFIQRNYPVNQDKDALAIELLEKLRVAVLVGIAKQTSIDTWALCGALERPKFNETHVTLFWKVYRDTMSPLQKPNKTIENSKNTSEKKTLRVYDVEIL